MKEAYVSVKVAKLLKENGFDERTLYHYTNCDVLQHNIVYNKYKNSEMLNAYSAPTQQMARDWLTEEKGMYISVVPDFNEYGEYPDDLYWFARVYDLRKGDYIHSTKLCKSSQEAFETAIQYVLTNLI